MLPRIFPVAALLSLATLPIAAQSVPYERYQLDNGMTVILHQDRSLPLAALNLWYRVGSKDEPKGRSGFAHLFEHLMFMGTERVPENQFDLIMESGGGSNNATTIRPHKLLPVRALLSPPDTPLARSGSTRRHRPHDDPGETRPPADSRAQ
ncbi:MAG: insulinase family protein [Phycisphaeraceae bacterium]|nr:insulinase family protein [Phycisphaeraceae bacterium]